MTQTRRSVNVKRSHASAWRMKNHWWRTNYQLFRFGVIKPWKRILRFSMTAEGSVPKTRPILLVPVHRTSLDIYAISHVVGELVSYVSTDSFGHSSLANGVQKRLTKALGSIVWQKNGIPNARARAHALARDVERRFDQRMIVAAFAQGEYQPTSVNTIEDGLVGLLKWYEIRQRRHTGHNLRIPIIPVGLEYDLHDRGLVYSVFARRLADRIPLFPKWTVPALGSHITVRFGDPQYMDDQNPADVTKAVMQEAAALSNIPFEVS